ncbi:MAG: delta-lactam-biosynthetic de-N-acetylase [Emergencia sp.]
MYINFNRRKLKKTGAGILAAVLVVGLAAGYRILEPGNQAESGKNQGSETAAAGSGTATDWGLSFQKDGQTPAGNASAAELAEYDAFYAGDPEKKILYLTFDAGYENGYTQQILDVLKKEKVPAAFFVVGTYIEQNPELIRRMEKEGHIVGNHTMHHPDMSAIGDKASFEKELQETEAAYKEATGKNMKKFYRPPQGKFSFDNLKMAKEMGYKTVFWSLAYVDWYADQQPTREEALSKLLPRTHNGAVILLHSTSKTNACILQELITKWKEEGYQFKSLEHTGTFLSAQ